MMTDLERALVNKYLQQKLHPASVLPESFLLEVQKVTYLSRIFYLVSLIWFLIFIFLARSFAMEIITLGLIAFLVAVTLEPLVVRHQGRTASIGPALVFLIYLLILNALDPVKFSAGSKVMQLIAEETVNFGDMLVLFTWFILVVGIMLKMVAWDSLFTYPSLAFVTFIRATGIILMLVFILFQFSLIPMNFMAMTMERDLIFLAGGIIWIGAQFVGSLIIDDWKLLQKEDILDSLSYSYTVSGALIRIIGFGLIAFFLQVLGLLPRNDTWNNLIVLFIIGGLMLFLIFQTIPSRKKEENTRLETLGRDFTRKIKERTPSVDEIKNKGVYLPKRTIELPQGTSKSVALDPKTVILPKELDDGGAVLTVLSAASSAAREKTKSKGRTIQVFKEDQLESAESLANEEQVSDQVEISIDELDLEEEDPEVIQVELSPEEWEHVKVDLIKKKPEELNYQELGLDKMGIKSTEDFERFLQDFIFKIQSRLSSELEKLYMDVLKAKESRYGIFSGKDHELIKFPGVTILEKGAFEYLSFLGMVTIMETSRGEFLSFPFVKILETDKGTIIKLPFFTMIELKGKGELINVFGFTINELTLDPDETLEEQLREVVSSFQITEEDLKPKKRQKRKRQQRGKKRRKGAGETSKIKKHRRIKTSELRKMDQAATRDDTTSSSTWEDGNEQSDEFSDEK